MSDDIISIASSRKPYSMTEKALAQRRANSDRKKFGNAVGVLHQKLGLHTDESKRIQDIVEQLQQVFTFSDLAHIFSDEYEDFSEQEVARKTRSLQTQVHDVTNSNSELMTACENLKRQCEEMRDEVKLRRLSHDQYNELFLKDPRYLDGVARIRDLEQQIVDPERECPLIAELENLKRDFAELQQKHSKLRKKYKKNTKESPLECDAS